MKESFYAQRKAEFYKSLLEANKNINLTSNLRIVVAMVFVGTLYFSFSIPELFYVLPLVVLAFILLVVRHNKLFKEKTQLENLITINGNEAQSLSGDFSCFNNGSEFIDPHHTYSHDLDIFGDGSLFQYLNRTSTLTGAAQLASALMSPLTLSEAIYERQRAIKELASKPDFRQNFQATGMGLQELVQDKQQLLDWAKEKSFLYGKPLYRVVLTGLPVLTLAIFFFSFFVDGLSSLVIFFGALQWTFLGFHLKRINGFHQYISRKKNILYKYSRLLHLLQKENFQSSLLVRLSADATMADEKIESLASLVHAFDARLNFMTNLVVNSTLLYDMQCVYRLEKWKEENAQRLETWINLIGETEVIASFATLAFNNPDFTFPLINSEKKISSFSIGHPLLQKDRIVNDMTIGPENSIMIITGANMAGKSTFLRTLGVNVVLALAGAPVCAQEFTCPVIGIRSGMRTADSLLDHQSYFYAELDRLKNIMDELSSGKPLFILLDEILKGTNSTDKQAGSIALVKQLIEKSCLTIIATHDLALGELEKEYPSRVKNFCFEPTIENDQLSFDYKLKQGIAQKMNATFLMKKMGIIPA